MRNSRGAAALCTRMSGERPNAATTSSTTLLLSASEVADVGAHGDRLAADRGDLREALLERAGEVRAPRRLVAADQGDACALGGHAQRDRLPDAAARSRDQGDPPLQFLESLPRTPLLVAIVSMPPCYLAGTAGRAVVCVTPPSESRLCPVT